jgi:2-hydroxychromene-2-carboxylate isomerase
MVRDLTRLCADIGIGFRLPQPFPQNSLLAARVALAVGDDAIADFSRAVFRAEFSQGHSISDSKTIAAILDQLGHPVDAIMAAAQGEPVKLRLREQTAEAQTMQIFGAPSFVTSDGELFWGNDRLEQSLAWAKRANSRETA